MIDNDQKILIVDDKKENLFTLEKILADTKAEIIRASNGNDALKASLNYDFALAILDVHMPEMDGYELAELLRGEKKTRHMPIIFLSAVYSDDYHVFRGYEAGAVDYITKPFNPKIFLNKVNAFLQLDKQKMELVQKIELEKSKSYLENILMSVSDAIIVLDRNAGIRTVNRAALQLLDYREDEMIGESVSIIFEGDEIESWIRAIEEESLDTKRDGKSAIWHEKNIVSKTGIGIPVLLSGSCLLTDDGTFNGAVLAAVDITDRKRAETEIRNLNKELESFSYSISHDLQAPLRSVDGFSKALLEDHGDMLDERGKDSIGRIRKATEHMGRLIDDLLKLSRLTRAEMNKEPVDLASLAKEVINYLRETQPGREIEFVAAPELIVNGDERLIRVAMENLLNNAIKFTSRKSVARIELGSTTVHEDRGAEASAVKAFFVRDNGVGFDMEYADKLFGAFQRLHGANEFPGTGIGLATVQRVIHRHGGRVWAEGKINEGATFFFSL